MIHKRPFFRPKGPIPPEHRGGAQQPPRWADWLLSWFVAPHLLEYIQGDLQETFHQRVREVGLRRARREYGWAVLHCLTPFFAKRQTLQPRPTSHSFYTNPHRTTMIPSYIRLALRQFSRHRTYTLLNIVGLTVGVAVVLIIALLIRYETSFDGYHAKKDRIYRVLTVYGTPLGGATHATGVAIPLPHVLGQDMPQLEQKAGLFAGGQQAISILAQDGSVDHRLKTKVFFTEPAFFDLFDVAWLAGSPTQSLSDPGSVVISQQLADTHFGGWQRALGRSLRINQDYTLTVRGVLATTPAHTDFQFSVLAPYRLLKYDQSGDWGRITSAHQCYVLLPAGAKVSTFQRLFDQLAQKYRRPELKTTYLLQPLSQVHYQDGRRYSGLVNFSGQTTSQERIRTLLLMAGFILGMACVNFINLSTAQAVHRAKEVGVRKALGTSTTQLRTQFLVETGLLVVISVGLAVGLSMLVLPSLSTLLNSTLSVRLITWGQGMAALAVLTLVVTLLAGFYPAVVLSGFEPIRALKSRFIAQNNRGISLRKVLVVSQFVVAQSLIVGSLVVVRQLTYLQKSTLGFQPATLLTVPFQADSAGLSQLAYVRQQLLAVGGIQQVSFSNAPPADADNDWTSLRLARRAKQTEFPSVLRCIDAHYVPTYQLALVAGRNLTANDSVREFLVNETLVKQLGFAQTTQALNQVVTLSNGSVKGPIVGVVKDFQAASLKNAIPPVFMTNIRQGYSLAGIKLTPSALPTTLPAIQSIWQAAFPNTEFEFEFLDEHIAGIYHQERQLAGLYGWFAGLAIVLSGLGLYGLASFLATQRIKEASVRKVLGAHTSHLFYLFASDFIQLIVVALVIASPLAWWAMRHWLQGFAYKINVDWWLFGAAGMLTLLIALLTISYQVLRVARANPVANLSHD